MFLQKRKRFTLGLVIVMLVSILAACGQGNNGGGQSSDTADTAGDAGKKQTTLEFWSVVAPGSSDYEAYMAAIKKFEQQYPDIKLNIQTVSFEILHDKLVAAINAGNPPDVSWGLAEWIGEFNKLDGLADLTANFEAWDEKDSIYPNVMEGVTVDGKVIAVPHYLGIRALLYNEDLLKQAGMSEPPKTWEELISSGDKIKQATGKYAFGIAS